MAHYLPPAIMRFFKPRAPIEHRVAIEKRKMPEYAGVAQFLHRFKDEVPVPEVKETHAEVKARKRKAKEVHHTERTKRRVAKWNPLEEDEKKTADAYKTLFVGRLSYDLSEADIKDEFEYYGPVAKACLIKTRGGKKKKAKSRGFAFVEFESSRDLKEAYKDADGRKINGRRILVDVERGRTVKNWKPRKLGGGLGGTRLGGEDVNQKFSGREPPRDGSGSSRPDRGGRDRDRRDRDRGRDRGDRRDRDRGGDRRDRDRGRDRGDRDRGRDRGDRRDRDRDRDDKDRDRGRDRDRERDRDRDRDDKDKDKERD